MKSLSRPHADATVHSIPWGDSPSNDAINHTLRHFLRGAERYDALPPSDAMTTSRALEELYEAGISLTEIHSIPESEERLVRESPEWWNKARSRVVLRVHEKGYWPRYLKVVRSTALPGSPGSIWLREGGNRYVMRHEGNDAVVAANWITASPSRHLYVVTSFRSDRPVRRDPEAEALDDILRKLRR